VDMSLPDQSGIELTRELKNASPKTRNQTDNLTFSDR
jgi:DNA-binding NarL/FixJ family response regulator